eukprot:5520811-Pyramimonas_sp.AAC.1
MLALTFAAGCVGGAVVEVLVVVLAVVAALMLFGGVVGGGFAGTSYSWDAVLIRSVRYVSSSL